MFATVVVERARVILFGCEARAEISSPHRAERREPSQSDHDRVLLRQGRMPCASKQKENIKKKKSTHPR
jgi:hypothetical protein